VLSLGLLPYAISAVCEGIFQAWEQMRLIAWVNVPMNLAKIAAVFLLLSRNRGLYTVILIVVASYFAIAGIETWIMLRRFAVQSASLSLQFSWSTLRSALTFLGIDGAIAIENSLNILFLSKLAGETQVGVYSSATQLMIPLLLVYQSIAQSTFPMMCRKVEPGFKSLKQISLQVIELLFILSLPTIAAILFLGDWALLLFYKKQAFLQAVPVLRIVAWMLIPQAFSSVLGQTLLATHREKITLRIVLVGTLTNLMVGWPLIKFFGLRGAAFALLLTKTVGSIQHYIPVSRLFSGIPIAKIIWRPLVAAACMGAYLAVPVGQRGILRGVSAILVYIAALATVVIWTSGGLRQFRDKYSPLFSSSAARSVPE
jgi:O-antigen/teichoic acid export membrane protein